jgi:Outer membrane protein Omp28/Secretion system C-terminal sorting domain
LGKLTAIKYHTVWPGYDPLYLDNPEDVNERTAYYQVLGVPSAIVDGQFSWNNGFPGNLPAITQTYLDDLIQKPTIFELTNNSSIVNGQVLSRVTVKAFAPIPANSFALRTAVFEKEIDYSGVPPGSNGETIFYDVMRKMMPDAGGILLPAMQNGQTLTYNFTTPLTPIYQSEMLRTVAFIQDDNDQKIYQSKSANAIFLGVENKEIADAIAIAPNPTTENIFITLPNGLNDIQAVLVDATGKTLQSPVLLANNVTKISVADVPNGVYFINFYTKKGLVVSKKIMVQH